ncbi:MAG: hypothetical protein ACK6A4_03700, partial [Alphaproteobacteria bacterium]
MSVLKRLLASHFLRGLGLGVAVTAALLIGVAFMFRSVLPMLLGTPTPTIPKDIVAEPSTSTKEFHDRIRKELPFDNTQDFEFAKRGFIATLDDPKIKDDSGRVVFDLASYHFPKTEAPAIDYPSHWRNAQLMSKHGIYHV